MQLGHSHLSLSTGRTGGERPRNGAGGGGGQGRGRREREGAEEVWSKSGYGSIYASGLEKRGREGGKE